RHLAAGADRSFVVFRGTVYIQQPIPLTVFHYLWSRFLRELGLTRHITPVIAVAANSSCNAEQLPWTELQSLEASRLTKNRLCCGAEMEKKPFILVVHRAASFRLVVRHLNPD